MNKVIKNNWHWFIIGAAVTSITTSVGISIRCSPSAKEKILYYICASKIEISKLVNETKGVCDPSIREIRVNHENFKESTESRLFGLVYDSTDIYIYPESQLGRTIPLSIHFDEGTIKSLIPNVAGKELYLDTDENKYCAIKVYDATSKEGVLKDLIDYHISDDNKQNYYLSFFKSSLHINGLRETYSSNALSIVNHLLEL